MSSGQCLANDIFEYFGINRLGDIVVHAGVDTFFPVPFDSIGRQSNDRHTPGIGACLLYTSPSPRD